MAYQTVPTVLTGDSWSASQHNTYIRDNFTALWPYTTAGDMVYAANASSLTRMAIGAQGTFLRSSGSVPGWFAKGSALQYLRTNAGATDIEWATFAYGGAIGARATRAASQSIANNTETAITFTAESKDTGAFFALGSPTIFTIPSTAFYLMTAWVSFANNNTGIRYISLQDAGIGTIYAEDKRTPVTGDVTGLNVSALVQLTAAQTINIMVYQNSGGALNATATMAIALVGP